MLRYVQNFRLKVSGGRFDKKKHAWSCLTTTPSTTVPMASSPPFDPPDPSLARRSDLLSRKQQVNNIIHQSCLLRQTAAAHLSRTLPWGDEWQRWWCQYDLWGEDDKEEIRSSHHYHQVPPLTQFSLNFHNKRCWGRGGCPGGTKRQNQLR